jgi:transposase
MKPINSTQKNIIRNSFLEGKSARQIAREMGLSPTTVTKYRQKPVRNVAKSKGGRPKALSQTTERYIVRKVTTGQVASAVELHKQLNNNSDDKVSYTTVCNVLKRVGLRARNKIKKPLLSKKHRKQRMNFVRKYENLTEEDWERVIFSDESKINRLGSDGKRWTWKKRGEPMKPHHLAEFTKHGGGSLMVWGCITSKGVGYLCRIDGGMDADLYCKILGEELLQTLSYYEFEKSQITFQQDNDSKHTSKKAQKWFRTHKMDVLEWPANSPDLNPIEHVWSYLKREIYDSDTSIASIAELWEQVQEKWDEIPSEYIKNLFRSMPARIQAVKKAKGAHTKY